MANLWKIQLKHLNLLDETSAYFDSVADGTSGSGVERGENQLSRNLGERWLVLS